MPVCAKDYVNLSFEKTESTIIQAVAKSRETIVKLSGSSLSPADADFMTLID